MTDPQNYVRAGGWKAVLEALGRVVLAVVLVGGAVAAAQVVVKMLRGALSLGGALLPLYYLAYLVASVVVAYSVYWAYVRLAEKRAPGEVSRRGAPRELSVGTLVGVGLVAITIGVLWVLGFYSVVGTSALGVVFVSLANDGAGAFVEEILLRGVVFRISDEQAGTWAAIAISVVLFSLLHLVSPHATVISTIVVGIEGGVLLSAAYVLTRRLWLPIGVHFGWDFSQDALFGVGRGVRGLLVGHLSGPAPLSGGSAGVEGSIVALVLCLGVSAYLLVRAGRRGNLARTH